MQSTYGLTPLRLVLNSGSIFVATYYVAKNECKYGLIDSINTVMNNPIFFVLFDHANKE